MAGSNGVLARAEKVLLHQRDRRAFSATAVALLTCAALGCSPATGGFADAGATTDPTSQCGNGVIEPGEECDDGNSVETDACTSACVLANGTDGGGSDGDGGAMGDGGSGSDAGNAADGGISGDGGSSTGAGDAGTAGDGGSSTDGGDAGTIGDGGSSADGGDAGPRTDGGSSPDGGDAGISGDGGSSPDGGDAGIIGDAGSSADGGDGGTTGDAGSSLCDGCRLPSGTCVPLSAMTINACGWGGNACAACSTGQLCVSGDCQIVEPGTMVVGAPCTTDTQCAAIPVSLAERQGGVVPFCKRQSASVGLEPYAYKDGYCTKRCLGSANCGADNKCGYFMGFIGELENLCFDGCTSNVDCRDGYSCMNFGSPSRPFAVCYPLLGDGGLPGLADAGPSRTAAAGSACASDTECQPPDTGQCLPPTLPDGGAGAPGGMCVADCSITTSHSFCGEYGGCDPSVTTDSRGPYVFWTCFQLCSTDGNARLPDGGALPSCRVGYRCTRGNFIDLCVPQ